jgi:uncharacterized membrane protein YqhA
MKIGIGSFTPNTDKQAALLRLHRARAEYNTLEDYPTLRRAVVMRKILANSRYLILIAVIGSFVAAMLLLIVTSVEEIQVVINTFQDFKTTSKDVKDLAITLFEVIDLFLVSVGFYIIALGLYELFVDDRLELPRWLEIHNVDDLKGKVIGILVVVLGVFFLSEVVRDYGGADILYTGFAIAAVIAALTFFISQKGQKGKPGDHE